MDGVFFLRGLRRTLGIGTLLVALVLTGAWIKSAVDQVVIRGSVLHQPYVVPISGRIGVFVESNPVEWTGFRPETKWRLTGLYTDARITLSPAQDQPRPVDQAPSAEMAIGELADEAVVQAIHSESAPQIPTSNELIQAAAVDPRAGLAPIQPSLAANAVVEDNLPMDFDAEPYEIGDAPGTTHSQWQCCGVRVDHLHFFDNIENIDFGRETMILIPHWYLIIPLLTCAAVLFARRKGPTNNAPLVKSATVSTLPNSVNRDMVARSMFQGWRGKFGIASLVTSLLLAAGWIRSSGISDLVIFRPGPRTAIGLCSAKEGLVYQRHILPESVASGTNLRYRRLKGREHDRLTVRPLGYDLTLPSSEIDVVAVTQPSNAAVDTVTQASATSISTPKLKTVTEMDSNDLDYVGQDFEWGGVYLSRGTTGTSLAIPYRFFVVPLCLLSAVLLAWPKTGQRWAAYFSRG